jgi:hypothetical protein
MPSSQVHLTTALDDMPSAPSLGNQNTVDILTNNKPPQLIGHIYRPLSGIATCYLEKL